MDRSANATPAATLPPGGLISRKAEDIARLLTRLHESGRAIRSVVGRGGLEFCSQLQFIDPDRHYIGIACSGDGQADTALLARPRANFMSDFGNWHIEFAAAEPQRMTLAGKPAIRLRFPSVIVSQDQRRAAPRFPVTPITTLQCLADDRGVASFDAKIIDISRHGVGFLIYNADITLEPGTVLRGCRLQREGHPPLTVDMEVRYSSSLPAPDGRLVHRSGCVFLNPTRPVMELIDSFNPVEG